jgi:DNA-binding NarL/FixJ family response regulator
MQISRLVQEGLSNKQIASRLFISPSTVNNHLRVIFAKMNLNSRTALAMKIGSGLA